MKKLIYGAMSLLVPVALLIYSVNIINGFAAVVFAVLMAAVMVAYTVNKFRLVGFKRSYKDLTDALRYSAVGNAAWAFGYVFVTFVGARMLIDGFEVNPLRFNALVLTMAYVCALGIIGCVAYLFKNKEIGINRKALMIFLTVFAAGIVFGCISEILMSYGICMPHTDSLSLPVMVSGLGIALSGYGLSRERKEEEYA